MTAKRPLRVACLGVAGSDRLLAVDRFPELGQQAVVRDESSSPGGTTANVAVALARLGLPADLAAAVGGDDDGATLLRQLEEAGVATAWVTTRAGARTNLATIVVSADPPDRTIFWREGAQLRRGDRLPIADLFGRDLLVLDPPDADLRRFLLDLPAHTVPRARLLGPLTFLADPDLHDAFDLALRHDVVVGSEREALTVTGTWTLADATAALQFRMTGSTLRAAVVTRGAAGCRIVTEDRTWQIPAFETPVVDPTGAGDAFAAGVAFGLAHRWDWPRTGRFANAMGSLAIGALGAQAALPRAEDVARVLGSIDTDDGT